MDIQPARDAGPARELDLRGKLRQRAMKALYAPRPAPVNFAIGSKFDELYPFVGSAIGNPALTYLEFGVFQGRSMRRMTEIFSNPESRFVGFDSFEGLPEAWGEMPAGSFGTDGRLPHIRDSRVSFVKGFFQNTLTAFLATYRFSAPTLVHFDADLYSSTLFLLTSLWHHIPEYYFIYDEFVPDEATAMYDFTQAFPVQFEFLACTRRPENPLRPTQLFGRMKNIPLKL